MFNRLHSVLVLLMAFALAGLPGVVAAQGHGGHGGGYGRHGGGYGWHGHGGWGYGPYWGGVGVAIGMGSLYYGSGYGYGYPYPSYPGYVVVESPPAVYYGSTAQPAAPASPAAPAAAAAPEPINYPRSGQSAEQTELDRRDCNRWATTQPRAMADGSVFHRATLACMEGRGYTVK